MLFVAHAVREDQIRIISARRATRENGSNMGKQSAKTRRDDLRPEYDLSQLKGRRARQVLQAGGYGHEFGSLGPRFDSLIPRQLIGQSGPPLAAGRRYEGLGAVAKVAPSTPQGNRVRACG